MFWEGALSQVHNADVEVARLLSLAKSAQEVKRRTQELEAHWETQVPHSLAYVDGYGRYFKDPAKVGYLRPNGIYQPSQVWMKMREVVEKI